MAFDDLAVSFDDEEEEELEAEEGPNRAFLIGAIILAAIFVLGLCVVLALVYLGPGRGEAAEVSPNELTNNANMTLAAQTATAAFLTQQAPTEVPPTETPAPPTETPPTIPSPTETLSPDILTPGFGGPVEEGTPTVEGTPGEGTPTSFIEDEEPTPTRVRTDIDLGSPTPGLPETGFSAEAGLVGAGLLALTLVVVVVVVRRLRLP